MRFRSALSLVVMAAALFLPPPPAAAQEPEASPPSPPTVKLSVKLTIHEGAAATFYPVGDKDKAGGNGVIRDFRRTSAARWTSGARVETVGVYFNREGAGVRVNVYAYLGEGPSAEVVRVADWVLSEGQEYVVGRLANYGVEPMRVAVVRRTEVKLKPPRVDNKTAAVEVTGVEVHAEVPSFELKLRNASDKHIRAVEIREMRGWQSKGPPPHFNWKTMSAIKPGEAWRVTLELGWNSKASPEGHAPEPPDRVLINSVLFTDGTYEGDSIFAAHAEAYKSGRRAQLARVLDIMREVGEWPGADPRDLARELAARVEPLERAADWGAVVELAGRYTSLPNSELEHIKKLMEEGMEWQRSAVLHELRVYANARAPQTYQPERGDSWKALRERYEKWLAGI